MRRRLTALLFLLCLSPVVQADALPSVALYYGAQPPLAELRAFDAAVTDPDQPGAQPAAAAGHADFAYVSLGEVQPFRPWFPELPSAWLGGENKAWGSRLVDPAAPGWADFVADRIVAPLWARGYRGFFLDTLDSYRLLPGGDADRQRREDGLVAVIRRIKQRWPEARLILNRGFEILPRVHGDAWMVAAESLYRGWDPVRQRYTTVSDHDRAWLGERLREVKTRYGLPVLVIDYLPPGERRQARELAQRLRADGYIPWVSTPEHDMLGVGNAEVLPRRVLVVYDPADAPDLFYTNALRFLGMPLAWLGLVPEYVPLDKPLPDGVLAGRYAGVVAWVNRDELPQADAYAAWLDRQRRDGLPLVFLGRFGMPAESPFYRDLGLKVSDARPAPLMKITAQSPLMGFEMPVQPWAADLYPVRLAGEGSPLLTLAASNGETFQPAALTPWGGYALFPYTTADLPGENNGSRWLINPIVFLRQALRLDPAVPVPDLTTEGGRRMLMAHIDGDGFASAVERPGAPDSGVVLRDEILKRYPIPTTLSLIEGETGAAGMYPDRSARYEKTARELFALPWVEAASHSFSHPFDWGKAAADDSGEHYHLAIPGYSYDVRREISGSLDYINRLTPPGRPARLFLWTGNCVSTPEALAEVRRAGVLNMNGGDTIITRERNSWTLIAGPGIPRETGYQVFAPNQNENVYTHEWTGPYYGFRRVIETFELTETPYRLKPVDIYYHVYAVTKTASLKALKDVYDWAAAQPLTPVHVTDYVRKVLDFNDFTVARTPEGYRLRGNGDLRTVRLPATGDSPDFAASRGVAGMAPGPQARYVHLTGDDALLAFGPAARPLPYVESANARIDRLVRDADGLRLDIRGESPLDITLANAGECRALWQDKPLDVRRLGDRLLIRSPRHDLPALQIRCPH